VLTEVGPVEIDVPRDREGTFEPQIVRKRQRRLLRFSGWGRGCENQAGGGQASVDQVGSELDPA
jgi:hypothetical protein